MASPFLDYLTPGDSFGGRRARPKLSFGLVGPLPGARLLDQGLPPDMQALITHLSRGPRKIGMGDLKGLWGGGSYPQIMNQNNLPSPEAAPVAPNPDDYPKQVNRAG